MDGLQIPSMAYSPSSTVSYFNKILFISYQNDRLIAAGIYVNYRTIGARSSIHQIFTRAVLTLHTA